MFLSPKLGVFVNEVVNETFGIKSADIFCPVTEKWKANSVGYNENCLRPMAGDASFKFK